MLLTQFIISDKVTKCKSNERGEPMANSAQALKRVRQTATKTDSNISQMSRMRSAVKNFKLAIESGEGDKEALFKEASKQIDRSVNKGLIHANKGARNISSLSKLMNK